MLKKQNILVANKQNNQQSSIFLQPDEYIKIGKAYKEDYGPFSMIGVMTKMETNNGNQDIFDLITQLSKGAINLFNELKLRLDPNNNLSCYPYLNESNSKQVLFRRYMKELKNLGIVKKARTVDALNPVSKGTYMINPVLIKCREYERACQVWEIL